MSALDPGHHQIGPADGHARCAVDPGGAEFLHGTCHALGREGLHEAVLRALEALAREGGGGLAGHIDRAVGVEGHAGGRVVPRAGPRPRDPVGVAGGCVVLGDEGVGLAGRYRAVLGVQGTGDAAGHGNALAIGRDGHGIGRGTARGPKGASVDHLAGGIILGQHDVLWPRQRLARGAGARIRADHIERPVRPRGLIGGPGRVGPQGLAEQLVGRPGGGGGIGGEPGQDLAVDGRCRGHARGGVGLGRDRRSRGLGHIDRGLAAGGREGDRLVRRPDDLQGKAVGGGGQGVGVRAGSDGLGNPGNPDVLERGLQPGGLELAVEIGHHIGQGPRGRAHFAQVETDGLGRSVGQLHIGGKRHVPGHGGGTDRSPV